MSGLKGFTSHVGFTRWRTTRFRFFGWCCATLPAVALAGGRVLVGVSIDSSISFSSTSNEQRGDGGGLADGGTPSRFSEDMTPRPVPAQN